MFSANRETEHHSRGCTRGVNSFAHIPLVEMSARGDGDGDVFLTPASLVAWDFSYFLGQGTYSTEGLHLRAQRR